jgi:hypothetical protein
MCCVELDASVITSETFLKKPYLAIDIYVTLYRHVCPVEFRVLQHTVLIDILQ